MKFQELKAATRTVWDYTHTLHGAIALPENFKPEMRLFGDLRRKSTWIQAYCTLYALEIHDCVLDAYIVPLRLSIKEEDWRYPYRNPIFDEFMKLPESLDLLRLGLEQLYIDPDYCTPEEREDGHGVLKLVQEQSTGQRLIFRLSRQAIAISLR